MFSKTFKNFFKCFVNNLKTFLKCWARALVHPRAPGGARERDPISYLDTAPVFGSALFLIWFCLVLVASSARHSCLCLILCSLCMHSLSLHCATFSIGPALLRPTCCVPNALLKHLLEHTHSGLSAHKHLRKHLHLPEHLPEHEHLLKNLFEHKDSGHSMHSRHHTKAPIQGLYQRSAITRRDLRSGSIRRLPE